MTALRSLYHRIIIGGITFWFGKSSEPDPSIKYRSGSRFVQIHEAAAAVFDRLYRALFCAYYNP